MSTVRCIFERGIDIRLVGERWRISSGLSDLSYTSLSEAAGALSPLRPVLLYSGPAGEQDRPSLMRPNVWGFFRSTRQSSAGRDWRTMDHAYQLEYLVDAIQYHCINIGKLYAAIVMTFMEHLQQDGEFGKSGVAALSHQTEPYFEFDALIGCARRAYDSTRYLLWALYGDRGSVPNSLEATLKGHHRIPPDLHARLASSWHQFGIPLSDYRHCIHHYVSVDFAMASAVMRRLPIGAWGVTMRIPDNPQVRSHKHFTFRRDLDALTYAWELAFEMLDVAKAVSDAP